MMRICQKKNASTSPALEYITKLLAGGVLCSKCILGKDGARESISSEGAAACKTLEGIADVIAISAAAIALENKNETRTAKTKCKTQRENETRNMPQQQKNNKKH